MRWLLERRIYYAHESIDKIISVENIPEHLKVTPMLDLHREMLSFPIVKIGYFVSDIQASALKMATDHGIGPFFMIENIELSWAIHRDVERKFVHSSAYGQWGNIMVELVQQDSEGPSPFRDLYGPGEEGIHHVAMIVDSLEDAYAQCQKLGYPIASYERRFIMEQTSPLEIGIVVIDLERMVKFYTEVFGCVEQRRAAIPSELSAGLRVAPNGYENVWLEFPGGEIVKLVRPPEPPEPALRPEYAAGHTGIAYFTLYCSDIAGAIAVAEQSGATLLSERVLAEEGIGVKLAFLADPEANVFEFVER